MDDSARRDVERAAAWLMPESGNPAVHSTTKNESVLEIEDSYVHSIVQSCPQ